MNSVRNTPSAPSFPKHLFVAGLGQIGGSFILAAQKKRLFQTYSGWDRHGETNRRAERSLGIRIVPFDERPQETDVIVLATPVHHMHRYIEQLQQSRNSPLVMDLGSTKVDILNWIHRTHRSIRFIGGHPMAGTEQTGYRGWNPSLFSNRYFFLSGKKNSQRSTRDLQLARTIVRTIGAIPIDVDPHDHDHMLAYTSHLPYLMAVALVSACKTIVTKSDLPFIGTGFESGTRLAASSPEMMQGILHANKKNILTAMEKYERITGRIRHCIEQDDWKGLARILSAGQKAKRSYRRKSDPVGDSLFY